MLSNKTEKFLSILTILLIPSQLALHFWPSSAFVFGVRVDYLAPTIYLTDIFAGYLILINVRIFKKYWKYLLALFVLAAVNTFLAQSSMVTFYKWLKVFEFVLIGIYFAKRGLIKKEEAVRTLFYSAASFSLIGVIQFLAGHTIGGPLYLLGERTFSLSTPGIALIKLFGIDHMRAYSTFPHPNALAGFLGIVIILAVYYKFIKLSLLNLILGLMIFICFILTFSLSSWIGIFIAFVGSFISYLAIFYFLIIIFSILFPIYANWLKSPTLSLGQSFTQRIELGVLSGQVISQKFVTGLGLGNFVLKSQLIQPVHNIFLLVFSETGIFGLFVFAYALFKKITGKYALLFIFIAVTGFMDHYWISLQQNTFLLTLLVAMF